MRKYYCGVCGKAIAGKKTVGSTQIRTRTQITGDVMWLNNRMTYVHVQCKGKTAGR